MLVLTSTFPRWDGDVEPRFILDLCRYLSPYVDIKVIAPHTQGAKREEVLEGVSVQRFRYMFASCETLAYQGGIATGLREKKWRVLLIPFFLAGLWWTVRRTLRSWKPDAVHAQWIIPQGLVACVAARKSVPVLCTSHGGDLYGLQSGIFRLLKAWTLASARAVTVVSDSMVPKVRELAREVPVEVIPMGTDLQSRFVPPSDEAVRRNNEIVFVGRLVEKKGVSHLIEAFAILVRTAPDLTLTIAGHGPMYGDLERQVSRLGLQSRVQLLGGLRHDDIPLLYQRATLAVFPFIVAKGGDQEGFGLVIAEAMGCGCPVIASDLPAVRQSIEPGVSGLLAPAGNAQLLADVIAQLLPDESMRTRLAAAALDRVRSRFDWPIIARQYANKLTSIAGT